MGGCCLKASSDNFTDAESFFMRRGDKSKLLQSDTSGNFVEGISIKEEVERKFGS